MTIGRLTIPEIRLSSVSDVTASGGSLEIKGRIPTDSGALAAATRAALDGMLNNIDEPIIPLTMSGDPSLDGWYSLNSVSIEAGPGAMAIGWWPLSVSLERGPRTDGRWEAQTVGGPRTNYVSYSGAKVPLFAFPNAADSKLWISGNTDTSVVLETATGAIEKRMASAATTYNGYPNWLVAPGHHYDGAAAIYGRVEDGIGGEIWVPMSGRRWATGLSGWRIGNGIIDVIHRGGAQIEVRKWQSVSGVWQWVAQTFEFEGGFTLSQPAILRNDPLNASLEVVVSSSTGNGQRWAIFSVRRGHQIARVVTRANTVTTWSIVPDVPQTWTNQTTYARGPAVGIGATQWILTSLRPWTIPTDGGLRSTYTDLGASGDFGIGVSGAATIGEYFAAQDDRIKMGSR